MSSTQKDLQHEANNIAERGKEMASETASRVKDVGAKVAQKAGEAGSFIGKKADEATSAVGAGMKNVAGAIREKTPENGVIGAAGAAVADTLESGGKYLQQQGLSGVGDDLTNMIRRNPIPAVLLCVGVGYLIARATSSRS